ncbi:MAG: adenylate/guanylate cyclase domain-containing protein, partial [Patescibacteria group bacterium]
SEKLEPEDLAKKLNDYLTRMTNIVFKYSGVLDKYIGDAVMAFWNAPIADADHALKACQTALEMQEQAGEFEIRIGINTGDMVVGNMGSQMRFDYSLLGDNVNLGSRLEGTNKEYGTKILISESTNKQIANKLITRFIDTVAVKGKEQGIKIYELRSTMYDESFDKARELYEKGEFDKAAKLFAKIKNDPPSEILLKRCQEGWNGIYHAKQK